jgi:DsbC/DsbD-like thiol-disulfide interchange protein
MRLLTSLIFSLLLASAGAETKPPKGVDATLVSENRSIAAGKKFTVALKLHHHEKFHTYWMNPGVAGVPTKIVWQLPEGFSAGPIQWPYPEKSMMAIYPVHGYERDVMLLVDITPPAEISSTKVTLQATASWMACADGCFPGKISLGLDLPVAAEPSVDETFSKARQEIPQPLGNWDARLVSAEDAPEIRFHLKPDKPGSLLPDDVYFFSSDGQVSSDQPQHIEKKEDGYEIILKRAEFGPKGRTNLVGVLASKSPLGKNGPCFAAIEAK